MQAKQFLLPVRLFTSTAVAGLLLWTGNAVQAQQRGDFQDRSGQDRQSRMYDQDWSRTGQDSYWEGDRQTQQRGQQGRQQDRWANQQRGGQDDRWMDQQRGGPQGQWADQQRDRRGEDFMRDEARGRQQYTDRGQRERFYDEYARDRYDADRFGQQPSDRYQDRYGRQDYRDETYRGRMDRPDRYGEMRQFGREDARYGQQTDRYTFRDRERTGQRGGAALGVQLGGTERGVVVQRVAPGSPADRAGIREGDEIVSVDNRDVRDDLQVVRIIDAFDPNETVSLELNRDGRTIPVEIRLTSHQQAFRDSDREVSYGYRGDRQQDRWQQDEQRAQRDRPSMEGRQQFRGDAGQRQQDRFGSQSRGFDQRSQDWDRTEWQQDQRQQRDMGQSQQGQQRQQRDVGQSQQYREY